jgi:hypothetical protein
MHRLMASSPHSPCRELVVTADTRTDTEDGTRIRTLWAAVLFGPIASLLALELGYLLVRRACMTGQTLPIHLSFLGTLLLALAGAALGWRELRRWGARPAGEDGAREGRSRFLALLGVLSGGTFALVIVAQWSANFFLHPCQ